VRAERGSVTAEFAIAMPVVLATVALCAAVVIGAAASAGLAASAASAARLVARGDDPGAAGLPAGTAVSIEPQGSTTCVRLTASDGALSAIGVRISARACALDERTDE
jgi:Flp pilus assembly protein TadG